MIDRDKMRLALIVIAIGAMLLYHSSNSLLPEAERDAFLVMKISQVVVISVLSIFFLYSKWVTKLLGGAYVGGCYKGESEQYDVSQRSDECVAEGIVEPKRSLDFIVRQNLFETNINGSSFEFETRNLISTWRGKAFEVSNELHVFAIVLTSSRGEYGMLQASFKNDQCVGFYYSAEPDGKTYRFSAKRISD